MNHSTTVKKYYENNTRRFLWFHRDAATKSIHQPLWKDKNFTLKDAFFYSNKLILEEIENYPKKEEINIIDLGCGVGSSLFYLAERLGAKANYFGVSISSTQIKMAKERARNQINTLKNQPSINFITADFTQLPKEIPIIDIAFSIEAFAHAAKARTYFEQISHKLIKGGKIILIDDFLNDDMDYTTLDNKAQKAIADFKYGWVVNSLKTKKELSVIATEFGLKIIEETDLTSYMKIYTLKNKWIRFLVTTFRWLYELLPWKSVYFRSWIGGNGKQYCLQKGIVRYKKIVFEK